MWLFGSLARGDWDARSDVDLLAVAPDQSAADQLSEALLGAGLADDVIALSQGRWLERQRGDDPWWRGICRDALRLQPTRPTAISPWRPMPAREVSMLLALDQEPERSHSIERLVLALELCGLDTAPLRQPQLKTLQRMTTASRYPDGDEAPVDLFDARDGALALEVARAVVGFADQQLGELA